MTKLAHSLMPHILCNNSHLSLERQISCTSPCATYAHNPMTPFHAGASPKQSISTLPSIVTFLVSMLAKHIRGKIPHTYPGQAPGSKGNINNFRIHHDEYEHHSKTKSKSIEAQQHLTRKSLKHLPDSSARASYDGTSLF